MKRRKGVTVFGALLCAFVILAIAAFAVTVFFGNDTVKAYFDFFAVNKAILGTFTSFNT